jgi:serine protease
MDELQKAGFPSQLSPEEVSADIRRNGLYTQRRLVRKVGAPAPASSPPSVPSIPGRLLVDASTKESNELVILLNYDYTAKLTPDLAAGASAPAVERNFVRAAMAHSPSVSDALGNPAHIRYVIQSDRMSDADRIAGEGLNDPRERLERYMVVRYDNIELARLAVKRIKGNPAFSYVGNNSTMNLSNSPNDAYFSPVAGLPAYYQWGLHIMNFPAAWDIASGQSYIGILDADWPGVAVGSSLTVHRDLQKNFRMHMISRPISTSGGAQNHTIHVAGIIAAQQNNKTNTESGWVAGACPECSFVTYPYFLQSDRNANPTPAMLDSAAASQVTAAVDSGMQVINWSGGRPDSTCSSAQVLCDALAFASNRGVLVVVSSGNSNFTTGPQFPGNTHDGSPYSYSVLPVGGISPNGSRWVRVPFSNDPESGSNWPSSYGVMAPAQSIPSTFYPNTDYRHDLGCTDSTTDDESSGRFPEGVGDGVGSCTGTSMAAPHISALAGLIFSVNPRATANSVRNIIRQSGNRAGNPNAEYGYGLPSATSAVNSALSANPTRLTPLFSYYSSGRLDSFYTTVPQMARAAAKGKMLPRVANWPESYNTYQAYYGVGVNGYSLPQGGFVVGPDNTVSIKAETWIFTTSANPMNAAVPLRPIYRMSWKCGDLTPYPPSICWSTPYHVDTVLVGKDEIAYFAWLGYQVDGLEGFIYPPDQPQPPGTVKLMRKYNSNRDDHAMFPDTANSTMYNEGYTNYSNYSDWLGYVYPNTGSTPAIYAASLTEVQGRWFRMTNDYLGPLSSLDTYSNGYNDPFMGATGNYSGQYWYLTSMGGDWYRLTNSFLGIGRPLDTYSGTINAPFMGTGNYSGQYWHLTAYGDRCFRLTNMFLGEGRSLDTYADTHTPFMGTTGNYSGQCWRLTVM